MGRMEHSSCHEPGLRSEDHETCGGTRVAPSQEAGAGATGCGGTRAARAEGHNPMS
jgi:hypothetical protein